jgi:hypothetical protein
MRFQLTLMVLLALGSGCATTEQSKSVEPSGFLGDYGQLRAGREDEALLVYLRPDTDFSRYDAIFLEPVTLWKGSDSDLSSVPTDELKQLTDHLETSMRRQLALDWELVDRTAPRALWVRVAITDARKSQPVLDFVSTVLPPARLASELGHLATGTHAFVGRAAIELEILDSTSGRRLVAAVDERAGRRALRGSTSAWADVEEAFDYWADVLRERLSLLKRFDAAEGRAESVTAE